MNETSPLNGVRHQSATNDVRGPVLAQERAAGHSRPVAPSGGLTRRTPMKRTGIKRGTSQLKRTPFVRSVTPPPVGGRPAGKANRRARPDEPLASWCEVRIPGLCVGRATDRHHRLPRSAGGSDEASNTADSCNPCHIQGIHGNPEWAYANGWLIRRHTATGDAA